MKDHSNRHIQDRFIGFLKIPSLWHGELNGLIQFDYSFDKQKFDSFINPKLRLGKYVEQFISFCLKNDSEFTDIVENIQIQNEKITVGEIDYLFKKLAVPYHLELSCKFYIVDFTRGNEEIEFCIGPNNKDSLVEKLTRIQNHQLPLLHKDITLQYLENINFDPSKAIQRVLFKCQLFLPLNLLDYRFKKLNNECIYGFYIQHNELKKFSNHKFHIPTKKDWLISPHTNVNWMEYESFRTEIQTHMKRENSPMCWLKTNTGELTKFFVLWW